MCGVVRRMIGHIYPLSGVVPMNAVWVLGDGGPAEDLNLDRLRTEQLLWR